MEYYNIEEQIGLKYFEEPEQRIPRVEVEAYTNLHSYKKSEAM